MVRRAASRCPVWASAQANSSRHAKSLGPACSTAFLALASVSWAPAASPALCWAAANRPSTLTSSDCRAAYLHLTTLADFRQHLAQRLPCSIGTTSLELHRRNHLPGFEIARMRARLKPRRVRTAPSTSPFSTCQVATSRKAKKRSYPGIVSASASPRARSMFSAVKTAAKRWRVVQVIRPNVLGKPLPLGERRTGCLEISRVSQPVSEGEH